MAYGLGRISQTDTTTEYFLGDALGSVRQMTDPTGEVTFAQSYDPYGTVTSSAGTSQTAYGFTGEQYSVETQMVYLRARYYSPLDGRFTSRDTWSGDAMRPLSLNRWGYVEGNPINYVDPNGHKTVSVLLGSFVGEGSGDIPDEEPQDLQTINDASDHIFTPITNALDRISAVLDLCVSVLYAVAPPKPSSPNVFIGLTYDVDDNNGSIDHFRIRMSNHSGNNVYLNNVHFSVEDALQFFANTKDFYVRSSSSEHLEIVKPEKLEEIYVPYELRFGSVVGGPPYMWNERVTVEVGIYATFAGLGFKYLKLNPYTIDVRWEH